MNNNISNIWNSQSAAGITIYYGGPSSLYKTGVVIRNTQFVNNHDLRGQPIVIWLFSITNITITDCKFHGNEGTPIVAYHSEFTLSGNVAFVDNTANKGGAIALTSSLMQITKNTSILFQNNSATDVGGAIYVEQQSAYLYLENDKSKNTQCFYKLLDWDEPGYYYINFTANTAEHGGDHVYGASLQSYCSASFSNINNQPISSKMAQHFFYVEPNQASSFSTIASIPTRVCVCNISGHDYNCINMTELFLGVSVCPGEEFIIPAVIVGSQFGTGTGSIYAQFLPIHDPDMAHLLPEYQYSQGIRDCKHCSQLKFSVYSAHENEVIVLTVTDGTVKVYGNKEISKLNINEYNKTGVIPPALLTTPVYINVTLLPCPPGFVLTGDPPGCTCYPVIEENGISCNITSGVGYVYRNGTLWVNATFDGNKTTGVIVHKYCPLGYCKPQLVAVNLNYPDTQCAFNRTGTLCGACNKGYSAALGSSQCLQCPENKHLALLLFFAVAGVFLVLFIKILNLTVSQGTINGLIFYANIVWANQSILYPQEDHSNGAILFFKVIIAWMNLDFGIQTCFIEGLNAHWKTWLQFAFPLYIWSIAGVIIITSRYSSLMTKLFGNNSVPVLATLFLLSYSKLLRTIITVMSVTYLVDYPGGNKSIVWTFDGNILYCRIPHLFLFLAALATLLFLWLPYTSVLFSVQLLQRLSNLKLLHWIDKIYPIFDAYFAPFKNKHRYWVGVLLLVRGILLITFALTSANMPAASLLAVVTVTAALLSYIAGTGHLYKKRYLSFLEALSLLNLAILCVGALYIDLIGGNKAALLFTSVGVAFLQFSGIVVMHLWVLFKHCLNCNKEGEGYENLDNIGSSMREEVSHDNESQESSRLREPLIDATY